MEHKSYLRELLKRTSHWRLPFSRSVTYEHVDEESMRQSKSSSFLSRVRTPSRLHLPAMRSKANLSQRRSRDFEPDTVRQVTLVAYQQPVHTPASTSAPYERMKRPSTGTCNSIQSFSAAAQPSMRYITLGGDVRLMTVPSRKRYDEDVAERNLYVNASDRRPSTRSIDIFESTLSGYPRVMRDVGKFSEHFAERNMGSVPGIEEKPDPMQVAAYSIVEATQASPSLFSNPIPKKAPSNTSSNYDGSALHEQDPGFENCTPPLLRLSPVDPMEFEHQSEGEAAQVTTHGLEAVEDFPFRTLRKVRHTSPPRCGDLRSEAHVSLGPSRNLNSEEKDLTSSRTFPVPVAPSSSSRSSLDIFVGRCRTYHQDSIDNHIHAQAEQAVSVSVSSYSNSSSHKEAANVSEDEPMQLCQRSDMHHDPGFDH